MAANLEQLEPAFKHKVKQLISACSKRGVTMVPFFTLRHPKDQAKFWRQSRSRAEIMKAIDMLEAKGAKWLSRVLYEVGPQNGRWATNALPGASWHQWGKAVDCFVQGEGGQAVWSASHPGYKLYAEEAEKLGLTAGHFWTRSDSVHVQEPKENAPTGSMTWAQIDEAMRTKFSGG